MYVPGIDMLAMSSQQSRSQIYIRFSAVNALGRDEVHHLVRYLLDVPLTLLVSPDAAGRRLHRARVVSLRGVLFLFLVKIPRLSVRAYRYVSI